MEMILGHLFFAMSEVEKAIGVQNHVLAKYVIDYWTLWVIFGVILSIYDLFIYMLRHRLLLEVYLNFKTLGNLKTMKSVAETYYIFERLLQRLSLGWVGVSLDDGRQHYRKIIGPLSIMEFTLSLVKRMFIITPLNILIWLVILIHSEPTWLPQLDLLKWETTLGSLSRIELSSIFQEARYWWLIFIGTNSYLIVTARKKLDKQKLERAISLQDKIERELLQINYSCEEAINYFGSIINYLPSLYCKLVSGIDQYDFDNGKMRVQRTAKFPLLWHEDFHKYIEHFPSYADQILAVQSALQEIDKEGLRATFRLINRPLWFYVFHLNLYSPEMVQSLSRELLDRESVKEFLTGWTTNTYLTREFEEVRDVWMGVKEKGIIESKWAQYGLTISFDRHLAHLEKELEQETIEFYQMAKILLAEAIYTQIILSQYLKRAQTRKSIHPLWIKIESLLSS